MKSLISLFTFVIFSFGIHAYADNSNSESTTDLSFIDRLSPEGCRLYIGKVVSINKAWFSNKKQQNIQIDVEKFIAGGGKKHPKNISLTGMFSELSDNKRYIFVESPPDEVTAIIPYDNDAYLIDRIRSKLKINFKRMVIIGEVENAIFDKFNQRWHECRVYQVDRPLYREYYSTLYSSQKGSLQFIEGSINSHKDPSVTFNTFDFQNGDNETAIAKGLIMPGNKHFMIVVHFNEAGRIGSKEFKILE